MRLIIDGSEARAFRRCVLILLSLAGLLGAENGPARFFARRDYLGALTTWNQVADTNGDGIPDIITNTPQVLFGNGDGTFRLGPSFRSGIMMF